jgi:hypothetical protein
VWYSGKEGRRSEMESTPLQVRVVYNPHILHLLYVKTRYLFNVIDRHYRRRADIGDSFSYMLDCCVLGGHHVDILVRDLVLMMEHMQRELSPIQLGLCHFEVYLFRAIQTFRTPIEPQDSLFTSGNYVCETKLSSIVSKETHRMALQKLLREYVQDYYFNETKSIERVVLLFNLKAMMEKEVLDNRIDQEDSAFEIMYDQELTATLFYLYFLSELYCLNEIDNAKIKPTILIDTLIIKQRKFYTDSVALPKYVASAEFNVFDIMLQNAFNCLCIIYGDLVISRLRYYSKKATHSEQLNQTNNTNSSFFSSLFYADQSTKWTPSAEITTATTTTTKSPVKRVLHESSRQQLNSEYTLTRPVVEVVSPVTVSSVDGSIKILGHKNDLYQMTTASTKLVPVTYLPLRENQLIYTLCMYRLAFDLKLAEAHADCRTMTRNTKNSIRVSCFLCAYAKREKEGNNKIRDFIEQCNSRDLENPCHGNNYDAQYTHLSESISQVHLDLLPSLTLRNFKTLISIFWLFEFMPLRIKGETVYHNLFRIIDPVTLLQDLTKTVTISHLEKTMSETISLCYKKLRLEQDQKMIVIEREQSVAMACEIVNLFSASVSMQVSEIQRYERSLSTELMVECTELYREVSGALKTIYMGHLNVLLQVIMERHDHVKFDV